MKHPIIYIKNKGDQSARFSWLTASEIRIVPDISSAMRTLAMLPTALAFVLYEQGQAKEDYRNISFLHSLFPGAGILLITKSILNDSERRGYLQSGVNSTIESNVSQEEFTKTINFLSNYAFAKKSVAHHTGQIHMFRMPIWKRSFDILASLCAIIALSPLLMAVSVAIRMDSPGPIIYKSKRVGSGYRVFDFLKFRSMRSNADKQIKELGELNQYSDSQIITNGGATAMTFTDENIEELLSEMENGEGVLISDEYIIPEADHLKQVEIEQSNTFVKFENDPRITSLGRFLRKYSIDELPQLFNILRGDMSVVGNRPLPLYEAEFLTSDEYIERFMCPSGLTGLWQVKKRGGAGKLSPEQRKQLDIQYAKQMSLGLDIKIILATFTAFIQKENV